MTDEVSRAVNVIQPKTIICIVGKSGTGKTTWALQLKKYMPIVSSRTTREPRLGEISGEPPYHKFLTTDDYIKDVVTNGKVAIDDLSRGDDIMVADTSFGGNTYWATASDIFKDEDFLVGYIIDPVGVANLLKIRDFCRDKITTNGWRASEAPYLHALAFSNLKILYIDAAQKILDTVTPSRRERDNEQDHLWRFCEGFAVEIIKTPYIEEQGSREIFMGISARKIVDSFRRTYREGGI